MDDTFRLIRIQAHDNAKRLLAGMHRSAILGDGLDFAELRPYQSGDDIRKIAWTISAKRGELYLKTFESRRKLDVAVAALLDGGVYCAHDNTKQRLIASVAMTLGYAALWQGDRFAGAALSPKDTQRFAPSTDIASVERLGQAVLSASLWQTALDAKELAQRVYATFADRSLLCLIGDFFEPVDLALSAQKHDVVAVIVRCNEEMYGGFEGRWDMVDPKSGAHRKRTVSRKAVLAYMQRKEEHDAALFAHFAKHRIRHTVITDETQIVPNLAALFRR